MSEQTTQNPEREPEKAEHEKNPSFDFKLNDAIEFIKVIKMVGELVEEASFEITNDGLFFKGMDPSYVALLDLRFSQNSFIKWEVSREGKLGLRIDELIKILKTVKKKQSLRVYSLDEAFIGIETPTMKLKLRVLESSSLDVPPLRLACNSIITITQDEFLRILKQIEVVSQYITIESLENRTVNFSGCGDSGECKISYERGMPEIPELEVREPSKATYSVEYLEAIVKHADGHMLEIDYSSNMPIRVNIHLDNASQIDYYLAPRVEN